MPQLIEKAFKEGAACYVVRNDTLLLLRSYVL